MGQLGGILLPQSKKWHYYLLLVYKITTEYQWLFAGEVFVSPYDFTQKSVFLGSGPNGVIGLKNIIKEGTAAYFFRMKLATSSGVKDCLRGQSASLFS